ncbi:helix-turn-helix domain-containing protein [Rhodovulum sp. DZ06]|uniref:TetR/AcrR family transcriptional regulator n=1 Tax=Rhodovulum sp. DZ06 TaxID=3425126 RepID=UPI003D3504EE
MAERARSQADHPSAQRIKDAALRLFSARGIEGVTVRQIVAEAGAKNNASLHYYFGSKEALVEELILDCAWLSDSERVRRLDAEEAAGGLNAVEDVLRLIIETELRPRAAGERGAAGASSGHMRFVMGLQINHRQMFMQALAGRPSSGYLRCIGHIARLLPDVPTAVLNQRLIFMDLLVGSALAAREAAFEQDPTGGKLWGAPDAVDNLVASAAALLRG